MIKKIPIYEPSLTGNEKKYVNDCLDSLVQNLKNDKNNIVVGSNTHIRGELTIYQYSKNLLIGDNCYLGQGSIIRTGESITKGNNVLIAHNITIIDSDSHEINASERAESYVKMLKFGHPKLKETLKHHQ